jgi:membrane-associated protease RseP (regulator of RpoE activity)
VIVSVDGTSVQTFEEASAIIQASPNRTIAVVVRRDGVEQTLQVTPLLAQQIAGPDGTTVTADVGFVGMTAMTDYVHQPLWAGPAAAVQQAGQVVGIMGQLPAASTRRRPT